MAKQSTERGSLKLGKGAAMIRDKLKGAKIIDWQELGTPNPEVIFGTVQVKLNDYKAHVGALTRLNELRDLQILINGTPRPDIAQIKFVLRG